MADQNINNRGYESKEEKAAKQTASTCTPRLEWDQARPEPNLQKLYRAAMYGEWATAKAIMDRVKDAKTKRISSLGFTVLHVAASCGRSEFVLELVQHLTEEELEIRDQLGRTALHHVALAASVRAAEAMVNKNPDLPHLGDMDLQTPLFYAAQWRHPSKSKEMLEYLHQVTNDKRPCRAFTGDSASNLIVAITASGSHDIALCILRSYPELACKKNDKGISILHVLAMQPSAFRSGNKLSLWNLSTYQWMRKVSEIKRRHLDAVRLVKFVCEVLQEQSITFIQEFFIPEVLQEQSITFIQEFFIPEDTAILHLAIEHGVFELVQMCLNYFPDLIWYLSKSRLLLHVAIEHRQVDIFNYMINLIGENTKAYADLVVEDGNNSLHLAAKLAPSTQLQSVPGPAFQMQRELQWFKAVEALVYYESKTRKNIKEQTPRELFIQQHEKLLKNAKDWMKDTSNSCMLIATLVATVAFAAMITVPGGNDSDTGIPILFKKKLFIAFSISNALSMIFSAISLLIFLSVQTSRYTEEDFLDTLPKILLKGLISLFIAVATMMISFGTAIGLSLQKRVNWACILITVIACCPAIIFTRMELPLLFQTLLFSSGPGIFQGQWYRKHWSPKKIGDRLLADDIP